MAKDESGNTALHWICTRGVLSTATILLDKGADINAVNDQGTTPLMKAAQTGQLTLTQKLAGMKANLALQDQVGNTALHLAIGGGFNLVVVELLKAGACRSTKNNAGKTAVELAWKPTLIALLNDEQ